MCGLEQRTQDTCEIIEITAGLCETCLTGDLEKVCNSFKGVGSCVLGSEEVKTLSQHQQAT